MKFVATIERKLWTELVIEATTAEEAENRVRDAVWSGDLDRPGRSDIEIKMAEPSDNREPDYVVPTPEERDAEMERAYPGWKRDLGQSKYGTPWPPDMNQLTDTEVRQWAKKAIDLIADVDIGCEAGQEDHHWVIDAHRWANTVLDAVAERLGPKDAAIKAYADDVFARANAEITFIRNEQAAADYCVAMLGGMPHERDKAEIGNGDDWIGWWKFVQVTTGTQRWLLGKLLEDNCYHRKIAQDATDDQIRGISEAVQKRQVRS